MLIKDFMAHSMMWPLLWELGAFNLCTNYQLTDTLIVKTKATRSFINIAIRQKSISNVHTTYLDLCGMIGPFSSKYVLCNPNSLKSFWIYFRNGSPDTDSITADKSV